MYLFEQDDLLWHFELGYLDTLVPKINYSLEFELLGK
jgi:hypothetical protein